MKKKGIKLTTKRAIELGLIKKERGRGVILSGCFDRDKFFVYGGVDSGKKGG